MYTFRSSWLDCGQHRSCMFRLSWYPPGRYIYNMSKYSWIIVYLFYVHILKQVRQSFCTSLSTRLKISWLMSSVLRVARPCLPNTTHAPWVGLLTNSNLHVWVYFIQCLSNRKKFERRPCFIKRHWFFCFKLHTFITVLFNSIYCLILKVNYSLIIDFFYTFIVLIIFTDFNSIFLCIRGQE